jgi:hypothetical protein
LLGTAGEFSCGWDRDVRRLEFFDLPKMDSRFVLTDEDGLRSVGFSPNGRRVAIRDSKGQWELRELPSGALVASLPAVTGNWIKWSPDGQWFIADDSDGQRQRWHIGDAETGRFLTAPAAPFYYSTFVPDGSGLVYADLNHKLHVWSFERGEDVDSITPAEKSTLDGDPPFVRPTGMKLRIGELAASRDGSIVAALCSYAPENYDGFIRSNFSYSIGWWDRRSGRWHEIVDRAVYDGPAQLRLSADGRYATRINMPRFVCSLAATGGARPDPPARELNLYDLASRPARCCNDSGFPEGGDVVLDPMGRYIVHRTNSYFSIYECANLTAVNQKPVEFCYGNSPIDSKGNWIGLSVLGKDWLSTWVPDWIKNRFGHIHHVYRVVSLDDGSTLRELPGRDYGTFTTDAQLWTTTVDPPYDVEGDHAIVLERWLPQPSKPGWLFLPPVICAALMAWSVCRKCAARKSALA